MKKSKIIWFDNGESETVVNNRIKKLEAEGWEVVGHDLDVTGTSPYFKTCVSILFQKEEPSDIEVEVEE